MATGALVALASKSRSEVMCGAFALRHSIGAKPHTAKPSEDGGRWMMTNEGRERAKARGVRFGRKLKLTAHQRREALARREVGEALTDIARTFGVSPQQYRSWPV